MTVAVATPDSFLGTGVPYPNIGASGVKFIPEIWSGKLQVKFYKSTVLGDITNNDWEGEIKGHGDKVIIRSIPTITVRDYTKGQNLTNEVPVSAPIELNIDKAKYFSVVVEDVDAVQSDVKLMDMFTNDASEQMKITIDSHVLQSIYADAAAGNFGATAGVVSGNVNLGKTGAAVQLTTSTVVDKLMEIGLVLDEQNVPEEGRFVVVPPWVGSLLKRSELRQAYLTGDDASPLRNGKIGRIDRFMIYVSNSLLRVTDGPDTCTSIVAGTKDAVSFASQITNVETLRAQSTFGNIMRGLNVYGWKTTKPEALVHLYAKP